MGRIMVLAWGSRLARDPVPSGWALIEVLSNPRTSRSMSFLLQGLKHPSKTPVTDQRRPACRWCAISELRLWRTLPHSWPISDHPPHSPYSPPNTLSASYVQDSVEGVDSGIC